jgi:hypothetical protein
MATYGFRIHTIQPHVRRTQDYLKVEDVSKAGGATDALDQLYGEILALQGKTNVGRPTFFQSPDVDEVRAAELDDEDNLPYFTILSVDKVGRRLEVSVETGREADHDALVSRTGQHEDIKNKAAVRRSTVIIDMPLTGEYGIMVSEVRGRSYAGDVLFEWLTRTAQRAVVSIDDKGNRKEEPWLNWKLEPRIDGERLDGILSNSSDHTLKLRRRSVNSQGTRNSWDMELTQMGLKQTPVEKLLEVLMNMAARRKSGTELERRREAAKDVISLVDSDVSGVGFDDGELTFLEKGKRQTINSETVDQLFVYPIGPKRLTAADLESKSSAVRKRIANALGVQLQ